jgi:hypothetical protein
MIRPIHNFKRSRRLDSAGGFNLQSISNKPAYIVALILLAITIPASFLQINNQTQTVNAVQAADPLTIPACASNPECFAFTVDTRLQFDGATTGTETTFAIPLSGRVNNTNNTADWIINWGDGTTDTPGSITGSTTHVGITHDYASTSGAGQYQITIRPNGAATTGWFDAFGFYYSANGNNGHKFYSIDTPLTDLMRTKGSTYRFAYVFYGTRNAQEIPANLFANISTTGDTNFNYMFEHTFDSYASNSTTGTIPIGLFDSINTSQGEDFSSMFGYTFSYYAQSSTTATIPPGLFDSIDTSQGINFRSMFEDTFDGYAQSSNTATIPIGLFDSINTSQGEDFSSMFFWTFLEYAPSSTVATIPDGLFDFINTSQGIDLSDMFSYTFFEYALNSTVATIPDGLFDAIDISQNANLDPIFQATFYDYARRTAKFIVSGAQIGTTLVFDNPYSVKVGPTGTPDDYPAVTAGDQIYPTYNDNTRFIPAPSGAYATNYTWYYKDGTSCAEAVPTADCGPQDPTTKYTGTWPNTTEWTPTTSTEKGNVTFYGVLDILELTLSANQIAVGGASGISPNSAGSFTSASNTATVRTNNFNGYKLQIATNQPSTNAHASDMPHQSSPGNYLTATTNTCSWNDTTKVFTDASAAVAVNTWGFTMSPTNLSAQQLCKVPPSNTPLTVKSTTAANETGDDTTFYYGLKVNLDQVVGEYRARVVYTAVANP